MKVSFDMSSILVYQEKVYENRILQKLYIRKEFQEAIINIQAVISCIIVSVVCNQLTIIPN